MARILIIDDELDLLKAMQKALAEAEHEVKVSNDARAVVEGAVGNDFDLVVTDMIMPGTDGLEVLTYIYRSIPGVRIVAISGGGYFGSDFYLNLASKFGAVTTLEKPFLLAELVRTVNSVLDNPDSEHDPDQKGPKSSTEEQNLQGTSNVVEFKTRGNLRKSQERSMTFLVPEDGILTILPFPHFRFR